MLRFPSVPALFVCHGWIPWIEAPPQFPSLLRYVAVDDLRRDRLVMEHGIPESRVTILRNFVDLDRFLPRSPLPLRPRRALLLSNQAAASTFLPAVESACAASGLDLTVAGFAAGKSAARPEVLLRSFDLVFARGRSALEAMAVGAAVILCDVEGAGPLVTTENFATLRDLNFGLGALRPPVTEERLCAEIRRYDAEDAAWVRDRVRREAGRREAVERLVNLYREVIAAAPDLGSEAHRQECLAAAAHYLHWIGAHVALAEDSVRSAADRIDETEDRLATVAATLAVIEQSPFGRLRARLVELAPLVSAWRTVRGWRER
jgi:hypothetical protein